MNITVQRTCMLCSKPSEVVVDEETYNAYVNGKLAGKSAATHGVQVMFPNLSPAEREIIISGTHDECFNEAFGSEDPDDR